MDCPDFPKVSCPDLITNLKDAISGSDSAEDAKIFGDDQEAHLSYERAGAQSEQGVTREAYPDVLRKKNEVENGSKKSNSKE